MKKLIYIFLLLILLVSSEENLYSQSGWYQLYSPTNNIIGSICFINNNTGFIGSGGGKIFKTTNGGVNWVQINIPSEYQISAIHFPSPSIGYISSFSKLFRSSNGGLNWFELNVPGQLIIESMFFVDTNYGFIAYDKKVIRTVNAGVTWDTSSNVSELMWADINSIHFFNYSTGIAGGCLQIPHAHSVHMWRTTDSGLNWYTTYDAPGAEFSDISFYNNLIGYAVGGSNVIAKTINGGISWFKLNYNLGYTNFTAVNVINDSKAFACGIYSLYETTNGGVNWFNIQIPGVAYYCLKFPDINTGYLAGQYGYIFKTTNGGNPIGISNNYNEIPNSFSLSQNYPNPFNPSTTIKFSIPKFSHVKIVIYDLLGRQIEEIIPPLGGGQEGLKPGTYEVNWDGSRFASGVYFYKVIIRQAGSATDEFIETKKMVLIK